MRGLKHILTILMWLAIAAVLGLYLKVRIYTPPDDRPFAGDTWYNPYSNLSGDLLRANFHAHTRSWFGLTFGNNTEEELTSAYRERGYDIIGISNYQSISTYLESSDLYIPMYEHGVNLFKVHNIPIGARHVVLPGFPLHISLDQTQQMLERTAAAASLTALAHPSMSRLSADDMPRLTGYHLMEVGNTQGMSTDHWDAALSAGRLIWILSDDDSHDLVAEPTFVKWNVIYSPDRTSDAAIEALRMGRHYGVESYAGKCEDYELRSVRIGDGSVRIEMGEMVNRIDLIGQGGVQKATQARTSSLEYQIQPSDTYLRAEIHMDECVYYLNPLVRTSNGNVPLAADEIPQVNWFMTWLVRVLIMVALGFVAQKLYKLTSKVFFKKA